MIEARVDPLTRSPDAEGSIVVLAPIGRDTIVIRQTLEPSGIACLDAHDVDDVIGRIRGGADAALVTEEAFGPAGVEDLLAALAEQPSWSDLPLLMLLAGDRGLALDRPRYLTPLLLAPNITILERPVPAVTLATAVQSSLRARRRQYEVRDLLARERIAREQAETATRIKDEFLATVSHELRTPLSAILLWSQLLEAGRLSGEQAHQAMQTIVASAQAQSQLIEDLLDLSRMLRGKLRIDVQRSALRPIVQAAIDVVRPMADARGVLLDAELTAADRLIHIDGDRVRQIVWNLLTNGVKFTPSGGRVSLRIVSEPEHVAIVVSDTGQGITAELLPYIFESFRQGEAGPAQRQGGVGLGLSIAQQLVELHGGTIHGSSAGRGQGATFTVRLPIRAGPLDGLDGSSDPGSGPGPGRPGGPADRGSGYRPW
jgi:signal transduction histidine kinase